MKMMLGLSSGSRACKEQGANSNSSPRITLSLINDFQIHFYRRHGLMFHNQTNTAILEGRLVRLKSMQYDRHPSHASYPSIYHLILAFNRSHPLP